LPKCQASAAHRWLEASQADLLPVKYYQWYNKAFIYGLLSDVAA
jgi:hypothetical protein